MIDFGGVPFGGHQRDDGRVCPARAVAGDRERVAATEPAGDHEVGDVTDGGWVPRTVLGYEIADAPEKLQDLSVVGNREAPGVEGRFRLWIDGVCPHA